MRRTMTSATRQFKKAARIILIGAPGVGKGTQTERLLARFPELASISSGDLLRENVRKRTPIGLKAEAAIQAGNLVPDSMILDLISSELKSKGWLSETAMEQQGYDRGATRGASSSPVSSSSSSFPRSPSPAPSSSSSVSTSEATTPSISPSASFILDGFPRTATQALSLDNLIPVNFVVHLLTPPAIILSRIASRWVHEPSGRVYNTDFHPPKVAGKDDVTGEPLTKRKDDCMETWKQRLHKFEETSKALLEHYDRKGCLWRVEGNSSDEITPKLLAEIEERFC